MTKRGITMHATLRITRLAFFAIFLFAGSVADAHALLYLYSDTWHASQANPDSTVTLYGSATAESDETYLIEVTMTQKDPNGVVLAYKWAKGQWTATAQTGANLAIAGSPDGTYKAIGTASQPATGLHIGCNVAFAGKEAYRHHYNLTSMGNPNVYTLDQDSKNRRCSHSTLTWNQPGANVGMTDSGLYFSIVGMPVGCVSVCTATKWGQVLGPSGPVLGPASCG